MKRFWIILISVLSTLIPQCRNNVSGPNDGNNMGGVHIRGSVGTLQKNNGARSIADAKKVLVFSKYYYYLADIVADTFSVPAEMGTGAALLFLDSDDKYLGHLSVRGLNVLPLGNLSNGGNTTIDLSTVTLHDSSVVPSHDPLGNEIEISETEIQSLKMIDSYYESIAKNIDANNDGIPDVLSNTQLVISTNYVVNGGHWGFNDTLPVFVDSSHFYVNYGLEVGGGSELTFNYNDIVFSGPAGDPYPDIVMWGYMKGPQVGGNRGFIASFCRLSHAPMDTLWGNTFLPFNNGLYTVTLDGERNYTLNYSCIDVKYNLILISPTLHTNSAGKLVEFTLNYMLPDGTIINPASVINNVMLQCSDGTSKVMFENSTKLSVATGFSSIIVDPPMNIKTLRGIGISYDDLVGNTYVILWN